MNTKGKNAPPSDDPQNAASRRSVSSKCASIRVATPLRL